MSAPKAYVGNVVEIVGTRNTVKGNFELTFKLAVRTGRHDDNGNWKSATEFRTVVVYNSLAVNLNVTFARHVKSGVGMRLIIVGAERQSRVRIHGRNNKPDIVADAAGPDLRFAIAGLGQSMAPNTDDEDNTADAVPAEDSNVVPAA